MKRYLILEDGSAFSGHPFGATTTSTGELAIQTSNFGYQEAISDPANFGKILTFTTPMIGGSGINPIDYESIDPSVRGIIVNDIARHISASASFQDLDQFLKEKRIPAIYGIDTRAIVKKLKKKRAIKASLMDTDDDHAFDQIKALVLPKNQTAQVSTTHAYAAPNVGKTVAVIDLGLKHSLLRSLSLRKINSVVLPYNASIYDITNIRPDAIVLSNGPNDPKELENILKPLLDNFYGKLPILGIGLGFLLISRYLDFDLIDLIPAYNGSNYPIIASNTNNIYQSAINLGKLVDPNSISLSLSELFYDIKSNLVAGFVDNKNKILTAAFNPEGSPGNFDATVIYDRFIEMME
ncbi:carbamoyl phosphate synthase small subunit [Lactobacillus sp. PV034]|uniref:carbamoyl phosphate synthase small subunit n=1 Tax=Lactobacillus sp. PV034 TaxID=2594495 RepID=UPI0022401202|nr:carbamoyl phosphate synthase small subunit [Lactobacillus sp. PV034]QNQ80422.1 carbamoyl phosphate synthase small subunit [Lactobacillus sp. PV034]